MTAQLMAIRPRVMPGRSDSPDIDPETPETGSIATDDAITVAVNSLAVSQPTTYYLDPSEAANG